MDAGSEAVSTGSRSGENYRPGSCQAHYVGISPQKNRRGAAGTLGEGEGGEEGCSALKSVSVEIMRARRSASAVDY